MAAPTPPIEITSIRPFGIGTDELTVKLLVKSGFLGQPDVVGDRFIVKNGLNDAGLDYYIDQESFNLEVRPIIENKLAIIDGNVSDRKMLLKVRESLENGKFFQDLTRTRYEEARNSVIHESLRQGDLSVANLMVRDPDNDTDQLIALQDLLKIDGYLDLIISDRPQYFHLLPPTSPINNITYFQMALSNGSLNAIKHILKNTSVAVVPIADDLPTIYHHMAVLSELRILKWLHENYPMGPDEAKLVYKDLCSYIEEGSRIRHWLEDQFHFNSAEFNSTDER